MKAFLVYGTVIALMQNSLLCQSDSIPLKSNLPQIISWRPHLSDSVGQSLSPSDLRWSMSYEEGDSSTYCSDMFFENLSISQVVGEHASSIIRTPEYIFASYLRDDGSTYRMIVVSGQTFREFKFDEDGTLYYYYTCNYNLCHDCFEYMYYSDNEYVVTEYEPFRCSVKGQSLYDDDCQYKRAIRVRVSNYYDGKLISNYEIPLKDILKK